MTLQCEMPIRSVIVERGRNNVSNWKNCHNQAIATVEFPGGFFRDSSKFVVPMCQECIDYLQREQSRKPRSFTIHYLQGEKQC